METWSSEPKSARAHYLVVSCTSTRRDVLHLNPGFGIAVSARRIQVFAHTRNNGSVQCRLRNTDSPQIAISAYVPPWGVLMVQMHDHFTVPVRLACASRQTLFSSLDKPLCHELFRLAARFSWTRNSAPTPVWIADISGALGR